MRSSPRRRRGAPQRRRGCARRRGRLPRAAVRRRGNIRGLCGRLTRADGAGGRGGGHGGAFRRLPAGGYRAERAGGALPHTCLAPLMSDPCADARTAERARRPAPFLACCAPADRQRGGLPPARVAAFPEAQQGEQESQACRPCACSCVAEARQSGQVMQVCQTLGVAASSVTAARRAAGRTTALHGLQLLAEPGGL